MQLRHSLKYLSRILLKNGVHFICATFFGRYPICATFQFRDIPVARHFNCATFHLRDISIARYFICATSYLRDIFHLRNIPSARQPICATFFFIVWKPKWSNLIEPNVTKRNLIYAVSSLDSSSVIDLT